MLVLAWVATSLSLQRLLLFYGDRVQAQRAGRKKFIVARLGDAALFAAAVILFVAYGTADIESILGAALAQGVVSDPLDKAVTFLIVWGIVLLLPARFRARFPRAENVGSSAE